MAGSCGQAGGGPEGDDRDIVFIGPVTSADAALCRRFGVAVVEPAGDCAVWTIRRLPDGALELRSPTGLAIRQDLRRGDLARRLASARPRQPLPRAVGVPRRPTPPAVVDATAGLGRDTLLLAQLGCRIVACERIPALALMLEDTAQRAGLGDRVQVSCRRAESVLEDLGGIDVVLLDPMYPEPGRAQVRKEMQICRQLAGPPGPLSLLVHRARATARERVVVKRHPHEAPLCGPPSFTVEGERVRFDVYLTPAAGDRPAGTPGR